MKIKDFCLAGIVLFNSLPGFAQNVSVPFNQPPPWAKEVIWYQIFVERFYNGDKSNDPKPENIQIPPLQLMAPTGWKVTPWTSNWYQQEPWEKKIGKPFHEVLQYRRYGGDLQGVLDKLDYLQDLGVTALFMNPLNNAPSMHKYDASHYHHIDVNLGPDPAGDIKMMAAESPADPATWKWTSADKLFLKLVQEAHKRKLKIIMDYSWNHTGTTFWAWQDILKNQAASPYKEWYDIKSFDNPSTPENEFAYVGWAGVPSLPEIRKTNVTTTRRNGHPYEGNINDGAKQHIFSVTRRWLSPDGNVAHGIDGFRLDVADQIGLGFWRDFRTLVRSIQPSSYLIGEIWWEQWPDGLMNPVPYTKGDVFDAVMFYQAYRPARYFFANTDFSIDAKQFKDSLEMQWSRLRPETRLAMMNVSSSHDAPRLLTDFYNKNKYKYKANPKDDPNYKTGKPDPATFQRLQLYLLYEFTTLGAPNIWNGEEMGMWGADDPFNRKPLMWREYKFQPETRNNFQPGPKTYDEMAFNQNLFSTYKKLIHIRKKHPALSAGAFDFLLTEGKKFGYRRADEQEEILVFFNLDVHANTFALPHRATYINLLTDQQITAASITLNSLEGTILKTIK